MIKKLKHIAFFTLFGIFLLQIMASFVYDFADEIQEIRRLNQISNLEQAETKIVSSTYWESLSEKSEIVLNNNYYDVVSYERINSNLYLKVIEDSFEIQIKTALKNILKHKNHPHSNKKKNHKSFNLTFVVKNDNFKLSESSIILQSRPKVITLIGKISKISLNTFKPPCRLI